GMSATCQIPLIAFYGRSGSMLHEIGRKPGGAGRPSHIRYTGRAGRPSHSLRGEWLVWAIGDIFRTIYSVYRLSKLF
ncbi:hypothetical protein, partial [Microcoleus sp. herbarium5]|uniref:hypothetical protein n=1 Tax=Microcoleus sp. herbarium5 TaxID=3055434 RepID=UPI002FD4F6B0